MYLGVDTEKIKLVRRGKGERVGARGGERERYDRLNCDRQTKMHNSPN